MRLQSAIFYLPEALLDNGQCRAGAEKVLSILKMESVWMYAVTALPRATAEEQLECAGLRGFFHGVLSEADALCSLYSETMLEKAVRRLRTQRVDTVVFAATREGVETAKRARFRAVAVGGCADEDEWAAMCAAADYVLASYADWLNMD